MWGRYGTHDKVCRRRMPEACHYNRTTVSLRKFLNARERLTYLDKLRHELPVNCAQNNKQLVRNGRENRRTFGILFVEGRSRIDLVCRVQTSLGF